MLILIRVMRRLALKVSIENGLLIVPIEESQNWEKHNKSLPIPHFK
jgi:hypothetical protein